MRDTNNDFKIEYNLLDNLCKKLSGNTNCSSGIALLSAWADKKGKHSIAGQLNQLRQLKNVAISHNMLPGPNVSIPPEYAHFLKECRIDIQNNIDLFRRELPLIEVCNRRERSKKAIKTMQQRKKQSTPWTTPYGYPDPLDCGDETPAWAYWFFNRPNHGLNQVLNIDDYLKILDDISHYEGFRSLYDETVFSGKYSGPVFEKTGRVRGLIPSLSNRLDENSWIYLITLRHCAFLYHNDEEMTEEEWGEFELFGCFNTFGGYPLSCVFGVNYLSKGLVDCYGLYYIRGFKKEKFQWEPLIRKELDGLDVRLGCSKQMPK